MLAFGNGNRILNLEVVTSSEFDWLGGGVILVYLT